MIRTNNKEVVNRLSKNSFKYNKGRNKFAIVSIILTTLLFTAFFTIQMSMVKTTEYNTMRMVGTTYHGGFEDLTTKEYEKIKDNKLIKEKAILIHIGLAENKELVKRQTEINYADKNFIENGFYKPYKGTIPKDKDEILVDDITLDTLQIPKKVNQKITLQYFIDDKEYNTEFKISGIYKGDKVSRSSLLYLSKEFVDLELKGVDQEKSKKTDSGIGLISLQVNFSNSLFIQKKLDKVITQSGFKLDEIRTGINWAYSSTNIEDEPQSLYGIVGFLGIIMISGYLMIYNIFYISIVKDIKFYGLLKTIGTTKKQINKIIKKQAIKLSIIGIPLGLAIGYFIGVVLTPFVVGQTTMEYTKISTSPIIFIGAIVFSLITVLISIYKPAKIASKVSPIESVRYSGVSQNTIKKIKKSSKGAKIKNMALSNVFRNKKKAFVVISSLSLSIILLNTAYTVVSGFDMDKYLSVLIGTDFTVGDTSFYRWNYGLKDYSKVLNEDTCKEIECLKGVKGVDKIYYKSVEAPLNDKMKKELEMKKSSLSDDKKKNIDMTLTEKKSSTGCYGIDERICSLLERFITKGKIDIEKFKSGNYVILDNNWEVGNWVDIGDKVIIPFENGKSKEYEVMARVYAFPLYLRKGYFESVGNDIYLPSKEFKNISKDESVMTAMFNVDKNHVNDVKAFLNNKIKTNPTLDYRMKLTYENEFNDMINTYKIIGYGLSFIVGVIGILNFVNVIISNIISRQKEIAMLRSVGMTEKQLKNMVVLEGIFYALATIFMVLIIGIPITYKLVDLTAGVMDCFSYKFTMIPIMICSSILLLISCTIPKFAIKYVNKNNIVESLREAE
ncbi:ABC transporter permease [Romboutsia lituseburensis]|nr:ABC transporter permease [Romboutsia lituseburensis]